MKEPEVAYEQGRAPLLAAFAAAHAGFAPFQEMVAAGGHQAAPGNGPGLGRQGVPVLIDLFETRGRLDLPAHDLVALTLGRDLQDLGQIAVPDGGQRLPGSLGQGVPRFPMNLA